MKKICGVLNIYKEKGYTSNDVVKIIKKNLNGVKVGHTGTLDPDAMGVLPICIGKATKISEHLTAEKKQYKAVVSLGKKTTTQDSSGEVLEEKEVRLTKDEIKSAALSFVGKIEQTPPMYSAIKIGGKRLYQLAREGKEIERKKRIIEIFDIKINEFIDPKNFEITVTCSKGTYIRTLCNDIGEKLGCGAHMSYLLRTKTGEFDVCDSISLEKFKDALSSGEIDKYIIKIEDIFKNLKKVVVSEAANKYLYNGNKISTNYIKQTKINLTEDENILVYDEDENLIGIYDLDLALNLIKPVNILF